ncbi:MAG: hypothetical protein PHH70_04670 [Candidatus Gracilibacteria bacterium]|nr:hypothetical protein [Candidatus Gracilibacteria bacterium]
MNYFDQVFFSKYLREGDELIFVCHRHPLLIVDRVIVTLFVGLALPTFFYYNNSFSLQSLVPFLYFEIYAVSLYIYLIYKIFDWYNDVWLITESGVVDIDWDIFARHVIYIDYHDIKGSEIQSHSFWDSIFHKGDVILYTAGDEDNFILEGAEHPHDITDHIEEVIQEIEEKKHHKEKAPLELLLHTLTEVVREHLEGGVHETPEEESEGEREVERVLAKKGTIDLR